MVKRRKGFYSISVVAKMFEVHQQTIRMYEKEGLISPKRSEGNTRLFSEEDVDRLEQVIYLTHKLGVNLAGVEIILKLQRKMKKMQNEMNDVFNKTQQELHDDALGLQEGAKENARALLTAKQKRDPSLPAPAGDLSTEALAKAEVVSPSTRSLLALLKDEPTIDDDVDKEADDSWKVDYNDD